MTLMPVDRHRVSVGKITRSDRQNTTLLLAGKKGTVSLMELFPEVWQISSAYFYGKMTFNADKMLFGGNKFSCLHNVFLTS